MNLSRLLLFPFFLLLFSSSPVSQKKKRTKSNIVKKKSTIKKSKKGKRPTTSSKPQLKAPSPKFSSPTKQPPSSSIVPPLDSSSKMQPVTFTSHQTPKTSLLPSSNSSLSTTPPPSKISPSLLTKTSPHGDLPTSSNSITTSAILPTEATNLQKTGAKIQKETLTIIQKIEPSLEENTTNAPLMKELAFIKTIIIENKPLPKSSLIFFAPDKQKITGISKEAYTELYRGLLDYYKNTPVRTNTPGESLNNPAPISSPIVSPATPPIQKSSSTQPSTLSAPLEKKEFLVINNATSQTITREPTRPPTSLKKQESPIVTHPHAQTKTLSKENEIAVKKENKKLKKNPHKKASHSLQETSKEKKKQDDELAILENKKRGQTEELEILIQDKLELISFLNQNIDKMNSTEQELKIARGKYKEIEEEEKKLTESSQKTNLTSFLKKDKNRQKQIEEIQKKLKTQEIIITDLQETHKTIKTSREVLQNNIDQKENEIREQLSRLSLTEETIKHLKKV